VTKPTSRDAGLGSESVHNPDRQQILTSQRRPAEWYPAQSLAAR
jgi:hypothetical protein